MKKRHDTYTLTWAKKLKAIELLGGKCNCGIEDPALIQFHHLYNKDFSLSRLLRCR